MAKMLTALVFTDESSHLPAVQDMALANELVGGALKDLATKIGGDMLGDMVDANPAGEIVFDDEAGGASDQERILEFGLKKRLRPKQIRMIDRDVGATKNWVGVAKKDLATPSYDLGAGLSIGSIGSIAREGPSLIAHAGFDLDIDSPTIAPSMLLQQLYQLDPNLRGYGDKQKRVDIELDRLRVQRIEGSGQSTCRRLAAGYRFRLAGHPVGTLNTEYTVTAVVSKGVADPASADEHVYRNAFQCVPVRIRPVPPRMPRPKLSDELARVVAVRGDRVTSYLDTNAYGYVHIRFDWEVVDDQGGTYRDLAYGEEHDTAVWVPVSQPWAGDGYGMQCLPREGMRVWVGFIEGQGERPFVKGCFYDKENELPFAHDTDHQKVGLFSRTIPENGGWSEISISDRQGDELLHLRAQRDFHAHVLHDSRTHVRGNAVEHVEGNSNIHIDKDLGTSIGGVERRVVQADRLDNIAGLLSTTVGHSAQVDIGGRLRETIGEGHQQTVKGSTQLVVDGYRSAVVGDDDVVTVGREHVMTVGSKDKPGKSALYVVDGTYRRSAKKIVLEAEDIIIRSKGAEVHLNTEGLVLSATTIQETAAKELKLRGKGSSLKLHEQAEIFSKEVNVHGKDARVRIADKVQVQAADSFTEQAGVNVLPAQLESRYALELFEKAADRVQEKEFVAWMSTVYGSDIPVESYKALHRDLTAKSVQNARIILSSPGTLGGERGTYDTETREVRISKELPRSAENDEHAAAMLFLVLLHEFGHHIDNLLRRHYTQPPNGGDAPGEEGAKFAYSIAGMDQHERDHVIFALHTRDGQSVPLKLKYEEFHLAVKNYVENPNAQNKAKRVEGFGAATDTEDSEQAWRRLRSLLHSSQY
ncbi:phage baseplate assembly protein V [Pendulispora rubella]|uniref:Phage baseplate assembly protein V n=1 Tax=Pendulispora rubella TaxID=2741070 RepID=A0ABZ2LGX9_9BACT